MLSPTTFIGIANATSPVGPRAPGAAGGLSANIHRARIPQTPPASVSLPPPPSPRQAGGGALSPNPQTAPPRNLPRGSLLDISV